MVELPLSNALLKASDSKNMIRSGLVLFHAFCFLCMKYFHLSFVMICSVLVAVSLLVSQKRLFLMQASQIVLGRSRESRFFASSTLYKEYFDLLVAIWNIKFKLFKKFCFSSLLVRLMTSRAYSNGCNTGDLRISRRIAFHGLFQLCCIHQQLAFQKSLHRSRNRSWRPFYAQCMKFCDRFFVIKFAFFCFFFMQIYGLRFGCLILFSKSTVQRICELDGCSFQIFRGKF